MDLLRIEDPEAILTEEAKNNLEESDAEALTQTGKIFFKAFLKLNIETKFNFCSGRGNPRGGSRGGGRGGFSGGRGSGPPGGAAIPGAGNAQQRTTYTRRS